MSETNLSLKQVEELATNALIGVGTIESSAAAVARSTYLAERDGIRSHGLLYVPIYAEHVKCGKVDGQAVPVVSHDKASVVKVDAQHGFAHAAINVGWDAFIKAAREQGVAVMTVNNSYNCGVLGHHAQRISEHGMLGVCFTHAPASIAPPGASGAVIGTNPFAMSVPDGEGGSAISLDQSASVVAKSEIMLRARNNEPIESHWANDADGNPTTDAEAALKGSMAPAGGYKGFGMGLLTEVMASCLAGALLSKDASPFAGTAGGPPSTGQCFMAFDPGSFSGDQFFIQVERLVSLISEQEGAHLPGDKAKSKRPNNEKNGVMVPDSLLQQIQGYCV